MFKIDKAIYDINQVICDNIKYVKDRGLLSQNILSQLRNLVEDICIKIYSNGIDVDPNNYSLRNKAIDAVYENGKLSFIYHFHKLLQKSCSHYTVDKDGSERLMLKYYEYMFNLKKFLIEEYNMIILDNLDSFPIYSDSEKNFSKIKLQMQLKNQVKILLCWNITKGII